MNKKCNGKDKKWKSRRNKVWEMVMKEMDSSDDKKSEE
jgi:hypothetical protein